MILMILYTMCTTPLPVMIDPDELNLMTDCKCSRECLNSNLNFVLADSIIIILQSSYPSFLHFPNEYPYMQAGNNWPSNKVKYKVSCWAALSKSLSSRRHNFSAIAPYDKDFLFSSKIDLQIHYYTADLPYQHQQVLLWQHSPYKSSCNLFHICQMTAIGVAPARISSWLES